MQYFGLKFTFVGNDRGLAYFTSSHFISIASRAHEKYTQYAEKEIECKKVQIKK